MADSFLSRFRRRRPAPTQTVGVHGARIVGGYLEEPEKDPRLNSRDKRYQLYGEILVNTSIVGAGIRYFLNLIGDATWKFNPSPADTDGRMAALAEEILTKDPRTSWARITRRAASYRFYGFSVQEWTAARREDGVTTLLDVAPRAQRTIERWDVEDTGEVLGMIQRNPQNFEELYLPRSKTMYITDDSLNDSPEGLGLFRHLVAPALRLKRYEQLEGFGFETDLRGIPVGRGPFGALDEMVQNNLLTEDQRRQIESPIKQFLKKHIKTPNLGLLLDSAPWQTADEASRPSNVPQWDIKLLTGDATSFAENAAAINRLTRELAILLGVDQLLLGTGRVGSYALAKDKTNNFFLMVDSALGEIRDAVRSDLLVPVWDLNGWDHILIPEVTIDAVRFNDVAIMAAALRDMASAGIVLMPGDKAVNEAFDLMGLTPPDLSGRPANEPFDEE